MREYKKITITGNREQLRDKLIRVFLDEKPGSGTGELRSLYVYEVEIFPDGNKVFLYRPSKFNNGFSFEVHISGININKYNKTLLTINRVIEDLENKKIDNPKIYSQMLPIIDKIYKCEDLPNININEILFSTGLNTANLLAAIKWLFIEQDIVYWNYSGRALLFDRIMKV